MNTFAKAGALRSLLNRLTCFKVVNWGSSSSAPDNRDREVSDINEAHVTSSLIKEGMAASGRHKVVLDIDHPTFVVESSTPGHHHLYIDIPYGIEWGDYANLLHALAKAGVIEPGYAAASLARGHSDVRLPWVTKGGE